MSQKQLHNIDVPKCGCGMHCPKTRVVYMTAGDVRPALYSSISVIGLFASNREDFS